MYLIPTVFVAAFATLVHAHFQLQYPIPRGPFVRNLEPTFCDGYNNAVPNRTIFPLNNGIIDLNSEHPQWTIGAIISLDQDPTSFADFNSSTGYQMVVPYFQTSGEGLYCFPINIGASNIPGIQDGANVTIQLIYDGGDGILYQCADLTLSANATVPGNATTGCATITASLAASSPTATATTTATSGAGKNMATIVGVAVTVLASLASFL